MVEPVVFSWKQATDIAGKTAIVTGVASGIGRATAQQFAGAGVMVYGADRNEKDGAATMAAIREAGGRGEFLPLDLTQAESIDQFVDTLKIKTNGAIDIIASVAGVDIIEPFLKSQPETWNLILNVNFMGPVRMIHRLLPSIIEHGRGAKIVRPSTPAAKAPSSRSPRHWRGRPHAMGSAATA
jgi:2-hydroxycyclohexanecarboxyl-CoA dehydrogenase